MSGNLTWLNNDSCLPVFRLLCNFLTLWVGLCAHLLVHRRRQKLQDISSEMRLQRSCGFPLPLLLSSPASSPLRKARCHAASHTRWRPAGQGTQGGLWQLLERNWALPSIMWMGLCAVLPQGSLQMRLHPCSPAWTAALRERPWSRDAQLSRTWGPDSQKQWGNPGTAVLSC